jgi:hypothetical protein
MQETHKVARNNLIQKKETNKRYYDATSHPVEVHVGDKVIKVIKVLLKDHNKRNVLGKN